MTEGKNNIVIASLSGRADKQFVFKQIGGGTTVTKLPNCKVSKTSKQEVHYQKLARATVYAKNVLENPTLGRAYADEAAKRPEVSAYITAIASCSKASVIDRINTSAYTGAHNGEKIAIEVAGASKVMTIKVKIVATNNSAIEERAVTFGEGKQACTITATNATLSSNKVLVTVIDRPNNVVTKEITL